MHIDFFHGSDDDAWKRIHRAKKPGRKHNHQARGRAYQKQAEKPLKRQRLRNGRMANYSARVAAYWRGELDGYPERPELSSL